MADAFVREYIGQRITLTMANEAGQFHGTLHEVGEQWIKVVIGKGRATCIPIVNIKMISMEDDPGKTG